MDTSRQRWNTSQLPAIRASRGRIHRIKKTLSQRQRIGDSLRDATQREYPAARRPRGYARQSRARCP
jgi:hypothetical protein